MQYFLFNLITILMFGLGYSLDLIHFSYLRAAVSLFIIFYLIGYNFSYLFFPKKDSLNFIERFCLSIIFSIVALPFSIYLSSNFHLLKIDQAGIIAQVFVLLAVPLVFNLWLLRKYRSFPTYSINFVQLFKSNKLFCLALTLYCVIFGMLPFLYKYIPGSDPYGFLIATKSIIKTGSYALVNTDKNIFSYRPFFTNLTSAISLLGNIDPYITFKFLLVFLPALIIIPFYGTARKITDNQLLIFLACVAPLAIPSIIIESWAVRPQSIVFLWPFFIFLYGSAISRKSYWLFTVTFLSSVLMSKYHELSMLQLVIGLATLVYMLKEEIRQYWKVSIVIALLSTLTLVRYIGDLGYLDVVSKTVSSFLSRGIKFQPNFLSGYTNVDGTYISMSPFEIFKYYLVNIGPFFMFLIAIALFWRKKSRNKNRYPFLFPATVSSVIFFVIAEVFPRFGFGFLPERAWPFLMLSLLFFVPLLAKNFLETTPSIRRFIVLTGLLSFVSSLLIVLIVIRSHQGRVSEDEYKVAIWIKNNLPENSVIVTQPSNEPMIKYFAEEQMADGTPDIFLNTSTPQSLSEKIKKSASLAYPVNLAKKSKDIMLTSMKQCADGINVSIQKDNFIGLEKICKIIPQDIIQADKKISEIERINPISDGDVFVLYSLDKFKYRYASSADWLDNNFYNADLSRFDNTSFFTKIYDDGIVRIWKLNE